MHAWVQCRDLHRTARIRVHRADVHLVTVSTRRGRTVVADSDGHEMEHGVGVGHVLIIARETSVFEVVGRAGTLRKKSRWAQSMAGCASRARDHRDRMDAGVLDVDLEVILKVLPHVRVTQST